MNSIETIFEKNYENTDKEYLNDKNKDYVNNNDKLLYCGFCHTPKEQIVSVNGNLRKVFKSCKCEEEKIKREVEELKVFGHQMRISLLKEQVFDDSILFTQTFEKEDGSLEHRREGENYVKKFCEMEKENIGLLLTGSVGVGKTYLASAIANALIEKGISVKMTNFTKILNDMMNLEINKNKYLEKLNRHRLLIIDDFGMERDTSFATEHIFNVIDSRYRANKPIIITTNLSIDILINANSLSKQRVYSRILEMATPIIFTGENKRIAKMKEKAKKINKILMEGR